MPESGKGVLYMLSSHIGNTADIPARTLKVISTADLLIFEEDRPARLLLKTANLHREYLKFSEHFQRETLERVRHSLKRGQTVAYASDQGSPTIADPGRPLLELAYQIQAQIRVIPGPSSLSAALSACPFATKQFYFAGFLPRQSQARKKALQSREVTVIMDTPYRLKQVLLACAELFPKRQAFLALDISGEQEGYLLNSCKNLAKIQTPKLNFVLILDSM